MSRSLPSTLLLALAALLVAACRPSAAWQADEQAGDAPVASAAAPDLQLFGGSARLPGRLLFVRDNQLWLWQGDSARQLTSGSSWRMPAWSPDGKQIAYVYEGLNFTEIFVMNADGTDNERRTRSQSSILDENDWSLRPTWSPDGKQLAYLSDAQSYNPMPWLMNADGSRKRPLIPVAEFSDSADAMSWSPDGKQLAVTLVRGETSQIYLYDLARGTLRQLTQTPGGALDPAFSPDGQFLAYAARVQGRMRIHVMRADGTGDQALSAGAPDRSPAWSPDGRKLAFLSARTGSFELWVLDLKRSGDALAADGAERQITRDFRLDAVSGLSWAP